MRIFKTSTPSQFSLVLEDQDGYDDEERFDSISFFGHDVTLKLSGRDVKLFECKSNESALRLFNAIDAFGIPCTFKHCNFITPAKEGTPADDQMGDAA